MTRLLTLAAIALALMAATASAASAPTAPQRWTAKQADAAIVSRASHLELLATYGLPPGPGEVRWYPSGNITKWRGYVFFNSITAATCKGLGASVSGTYPGFACNLTIPSGPSAGVQTGTYWVRRMTVSRVCVSDRSLAACPLPLPLKPLPGDPRVCSVGDEAACINGAATYAAITHNGGKSTMLGCLAATVFVYHCSWGLPAPNVTPPESATVTFTPHKTGWTTSVMITS